MPSKCYLAVDPGLATGMAAFEWGGVGEPILIWSAEVEMKDYAYYIRRFMTAHPDGAFICERFIINAATAKKTQAPYSLELIGVYKQCIRDIGLDPETNLKLQSPADAKRMFPNPALKKLGYWHVGGEGHAMDAIRHGLLYLVYDGWKPKALLD